MGSMGIGATGHSGTMGQRQREATAQWQSPSNHRCDRGDQRALGSGQWPSLRINAVRIAAPRHTRCRDHMET
jgi:hypothetical protein